MRIFLRGHVIEIAKPQYMWIKISKTGKTVHIDIWPLITINITI